MYNTLAAKVGHSLLNSCSASRRSMKAERSSYRRKNSLKLDGSTRIIALPVLNLVPLRIDSSINNEKLLYGECLVPHRAVNINRKTKKYHHPVNRMTWMVIFFICYYYQFSDINALFPSNDGSCYPRRKQGRLTSQ